LINIVAPYFVFIFKYSFPYLLVPKPTAPPTPWIFFTAAYGIFSANAKEKLGDSLEKITAESPDFIFLSIIMLIVCYNINLRKFHTDSEKFFRALIVVGLLVDVFLLPISYIPNIDKSYLALAVMVSCVFATSTAITYRLLAPTRRNEGETNELA
jgi:hypothetical protein